jgi:hypothetical protein
MMVVSSTLYRKGGVCMSEDGLVDLSRFILTLIDGLCFTKGTPPNGTENLRR